MFNKNKFYINPLFLSLAALLVLINLPLLFNIVIPQHDTQEIYKNFYFIYNELFFNADIPDWTPFGFYGVQSDFILLSLSPSMCFSMFFGLLLRIENALLLYNISILLEQFILLLGAYLLAGRLFKNRITVFIVCLTIICSTTLFYQIVLDFRPYIYLPFIIFFSVKFFDDYSPVNLPAAMIIFVLTFFGLPVYYAPVTLIIVLIIFLTLLGANYKDLGKVFKRPKIEFLYAGLLLALLIAILLLYNYYISNAMNFTEGLTSGRDPVTRETFLDVFLNFPKRYSGLPKFITLIFPISDFLISGLAVHVVLLTLVFVVYALITERSAIFYAFGFVVIILVLFSLGDKTPLAKILYYNFPMMKYFRHISFVVTSLKLFLPLMAGFGIDRLLEIERLRRTEGGATYWTGKAPSAIKIALSLLLLISGIIYSRSLVTDNSNLHITLAIASLVLLFLGAAYQKKKVSIALLIVACFVFQALSYQALVINNYSIVSTINKPLEKSSKNVNRYAFQSERTDVAPSKHARDGLKLVHRKHYPLVKQASASYTFDYNFLQWDPCVSDFRTDFLNSNVADLLKAELGGKIPLKPGGRLMVPIESRDMALRKTIGCKSAKIRLIKNVIFTESTKESRFKVATKNFYDDFLLISDPDRSARKLWARALALDRSKAQGEVLVTDFSANELIVEARVDNDSGLWLYYADAWHPGWKAYVNGKKVPIHKADIAFKAIKIEKGNSIVRLHFDYEPGKTIIRILIVFELLSAITIFTCIFFTVFRRDEGKNKVSYVRE